MLLITEQVYPKEYKPTIYYGNFTVKYYPAKFRDFVKTNPDLVKKHLKTVVYNEGIAILGEDFKFPDNDCHTLFIKKVWEAKKVKDKLSDQFAWVSQIELMKNFGKVNYEFKQRL
jgi:hypothetical protein